MPHDAGPPPPRGNLFDDATAPATGERFDPLLSHRGLVVERIVSSSRVDGAPYLQAQDEWVVLLRGTAVLEVDGRAMALQAGDHAWLPAGTPHRLARVSDGALWLAVHHHHPPRADPAD